MQEIARRHGSRFDDFACSQDLIGWRHVMEGVVLKRYLPHQSLFTDLCGAKYTAEIWVRELVTCLLEITYGQ